MGEQHELFTALGWALSGDRQLLPTLNVSLRTFLSHPGLGGAQGWRGGWPDIAVQDSA